MAPRGILSKFWRGNSRLASRHQIRRLTLHEYQLHGILKEFGIPVPRGKLAQTPDEAGAITEEFNGKCIIKPQILRGGQRTLILDNMSENGISQTMNNVEVAGKVAKSLLGYQLKTSERLGEQISIKKLFITETIKYDRKWYLAIAFDRENCCPVIIASKSGGIDIETTTKQHAEQLHTFRLGYTEGITPEIVIKVARCLGMSEKETENLQALLSRLYTIFTTKDATILEINSLVRSSNGTLTCLDAEFTFDDAAGKRQRDIFAMRDTEHEIPDEVEAEKYGLVYVRMDGNIGNVVNGAGLAMATNDAIALHGGASANFLDAGGQATKETMVKAFEIILRDERVKTILVNIYGGITRGDMIAESILGAAKELGPLKVPIVVRLQGTNSELGLKILEEANLGLHTEADFGKAAEKAVQLARSSLSKT